MKTLLTAALIAAALCGAIAAGWTAFRGVHGDPLADYLAREIGGDRP